MVYQGKLKCYFLRLKIEGINIAATAPATAAATIVQLIPGIIAAKLDDTRG
jgi:hypothetical protein